MPDFDSFGAGVLIGSIATMAGASTLWCDGRTTPFAPFSFRATAKHQTLQVFERLALSAEEFVELLMAKSESFPPLILEGIQPRTHSFQTFPDLLGTELEHLNLHHRAFPGTLAQVDRPTAP